VPLVSPSIPQQFQWTVLWLVNNEWVCASVWARLQPRVVSAVLPFLHQHNEITPASPFPILYYILVFFPILLWESDANNWKEFACFSSIVMNLLFSILLRNFHDTFLQIAGHSILAGILWSCARSVDLTSKAAITSFYMFIWKVSLRHHSRSFVSPVHLFLFWNRNSSPCGVVPTVLLPSLIILSAPPLNGWIPKPLNRVDELLLTIYSPRGSAAVLRGVPAHPSGAVRPVSRRRDGSAGWCWCRGRGNNSTGELECWSKLPFETWSMHRGRQAGSRCMSTDGAQ